MANIVKFFLLALAVGIGYFTVIMWQGKTATPPADKGDDLELRQTLQDEQEYQQQLYVTIRENERLLEEYQTEQDNSAEFAMRETVKKLEQEAGLTEMTGNGIEIEISPYEERSATYIDSSATLNPELLRALINDLHRFGAADIAIETERIIETSAFRTVGSDTHVNGKRLPPFPVNVYVLTDDPEALHNEIIVSESADFIEFENLNMEVKTSGTITIPAHDETRRVRTMKAAQEKE